MFEVFLLCPGLSLTALTGAPFNNKIVAQVCLRS